MSIYSEIFIIGQDEIENKEIYSIKIGKNSEANDKLLKSCPKNCLWFHVKGGSSPHGFLLCEENKFHPKAIKRTAELVKSFSKYKNIKEVSVEYTLLKNVKLTDTPGLVEINKRIDKILV